MTKSKVFLILSLSFIGGIFWRSFISGNFSIYYLLVPAAILAAVFYPHTNNKDIPYLVGNNNISVGVNKNKVVLAVSFGIVFFIFGFWLTSRELEILSSQNLDGQHFGGNVIVSKEPQIKENYQNVIVKTASNLKVLLNAGLYENIQYGDELNLTCTLKIPENKDGGFDYRMYLAKDGIFYLCQSADFAKTGENRGNKIYKAVLDFKNKLSDNINSIIPQPEAALGNGLIFGGSSQLSKNVADNFSKTGLSHIVAVSGYNVTIIANVLMIIGIFLGFWRKQAFWFAIVGIFLFVLSVGFPSSAIRAGVMGSLLLWAMKNGRLANSFGAIIFSAGIMLLLNPLLLRYDIGFQLSFLATLGIVELSPFWEKYLSNRRKIIGEFQETVLLTISATIFVLPIILYNFHTLSIVSVLANALVLPIVPVAMLLVFLTALAGLFWAPVSVIFAWVAFLPLKYVTETVSYLASLSWASKTVENFNVWYLITWYIILFSGVYLLKLKMQKSKLKMTV